MLSRWLRARTSMCRSLLLADANAVISFPFFCVFAINICIYFCCCWQLNNFIENKSFGIASMWQRFAWTKFRTDAMTNENHIIFFFSLFLIWIYFKLLWKLLLFITHQMVDNLPFFIRKRRSEWIFNGIIGNGSDSVCEWKKFAEQCTFVWLMNDAMPFDTVRCQNR